MAWGKFTSAPLSKVSIVLSYVTPLLFLGVLVSYMTFEAVLLSYLSYLFILNFVIMGVFYKRIQIEIANAEDIDKVISQYGLLLKKKEESFHSQKLKDLQQKLKFKTEDASVHLKTLSGLFSNMDTIANLLTASLLMEPFFLIFMY
jgi:hypothetical protein